jgi:hypothetical protein
MMAKGNRSLRKHELQIAVVLRPGVDALSTSTRPFPNSLDICKPFIEEGPDGAVLFVHSTVPQWVFILRALHDI